EATRRTRQCDRVDPWRILRLLRSPVCTDRRMPITIGGTNRRASVAFHIPRETNAGSKLCPLIVTAGLSREARIAGVIPTERRIWEHGAFNTLVKSVEAEIFSLSADHVLREHGFPPDAVIHGQSRCHFPCVRRICREYRLLLAHIQRIAGGESRQIA